jgi:O-antigen/teichoic acid export membrane protein
MSYTVIPASSKSKADLSSGSLRIGLSLTAPIAAALIVAPRSILSLFGPEYASADIILLVLSVGILPAAIVSNAISKFNYLGQERKIISLGVIQAVGFLTSFLILVPYYGDLGAAYSILIAYCASAVYAVHLFDWTHRRYISKSVVAVIIGYVSGFAINFILDSSLFAIVTSVLATSVVLLALKTTSISELSQLIRGIKKAETNKPPDESASPSK